MTELHYKRLVNKVRIILSVWGMADEAEDIAHEVMISRFLGHGVKQRLKCAVIDAVRKSQWGMRGSTIRKNAPVKQSYSDYRRSLTGDYRKFEGYKVRQK